MTENKTGHDIIAEQGGEVFDTVYKDFYVEEYGCTGHMSTTVYILPDGSKRYISRLQGYTTN